MTREGYVEKSEEASLKEMEQINRYTRREYRPEEVYIFSLVLCDNEVDRDYERFSVPALQTLRGLFLGKTCILDHERKSLNQTARIFETALEEEPGRVTRSGEPYTRLTARAYLPRTEKTGETIELIESGILKEVSISCAVKRSVCSICGKEDCAHQKGAEYAGKLCCRILEEPTDAYECSFVAVPAQREAGVRKGYAQQLALDTALSQRIAELEEKAAWGEQYREEVKRNILKYSGIAQPEVPKSILKSALEGLSLSDLSELNRAYEKLAQKRLPLTPQLAGQREESETAPGNGAYQI